MVDYVTWAKADPLTVEQAARLWAEIDPSVPSYMLTPAQTAAMAVRQQMLSGKIGIGALRVDSSSNWLARIGKHESSLVMRSELIALANSLGERPLFLFPGSPDETAISPAPDLEARAPAQQGYPQNNLDLTPFESLLARAQRPLGPTRIVPKVLPATSAPPSANTKEAPPPPPHFRGVTGRLPELHSNLPARPASAAKPPERRAAGRKPDQREAVRAWLAEKYPGGVPSRVSVTALVAELRADKIDVSDRTVSRALKAR